MSAKPVLPSSGAASANGVLRRQYQIFIDRPPQAVFDFFTSRKNHARICPEGWDEEVLGDVETPLSQGAQMTVQTKRAGSASRPMTTEISEWNPPHGWSEKQIVGPFVSYSHKCKCTAFQTGTLLTDTIEYAPPAGGPLGKLADKIYLGKRLDTFFNGRHKEAKRLLEQIGRIKGR